MSSLAGALVNPEIYQRPPKTEVFDDVTMEQDVKPPSYNELDNVKLDQVATKQEDGQEHDEEMADLFGNDQDVEDSRPQEESAASSVVSGQDSDRLPTPEREHRRALEYEEEDIPAELAIEVKEANVAFPNIPVPKSSDGENWVIRMPNFVKVDSKPYHPDTYVGPEHEDEELQQTENMREKSMTIKLKVENMVRWRWIKDEMGQERRQSNSRIIRWSDGTMSLRLGKELFDITQSIDTSGAVPRQSIGGSQASQPPAPQSQSSGSKSQGLTYLVAQHKRAQVLQAEAVITGYMGLRPTGMQSETHRMLVRAVGQKHNKVARLRMAPDPTMDPEREVMELMKQSAKKSKKRVEMEDGLGGGRKRRYSRKRAGHDVWSDDDMEQTYAASEGEDEEGGDISSSAGRKAKRKEDTKGDYQEDGFVVADEDDDEDDSGERKRRRKDDMMEDDPLEKMEAQLERQDAQRKHRRESGGSKAADDDGNEDADGGMDVESEEEDEFGVRPAGTSSRRKTALVAEEEEE